MSITFEKVNYSYNEHSPFSYRALYDIDLEIEEHTISAIVGATGSGKSTLVQHLNALLKPTSGEVHINEFVVTSQKKNKELKKLRKKVGLVFQFPEYQLFEETIERDIAFGPLNFGASKEEANKLAKEMLNLVGLDDSYLQKSPFDLSGGQKRRVAIAGILALNPEVLVLDEPTAGLDPQGAKEMMELFLKLHEEQHKTIIMVTHDMEHVFQYCKQVIVLKDGRIAAQESVQDFFEHEQLLEELDMALPKVIQLKKKLLQRGFRFSTPIESFDALIGAIQKELTYE